MKIRPLMLLVILFLGVMYPAMGGVDMKPGLWEIAIEMNTPGMPAGSMQNEPFTTCLTEESLVPISEASVGECEILDVRTEGSTVAWRMKCASEIGGEMEGSGWITYRHTELSGVMEMEMKIPGHEGMKIKQSYKGKYLGECSD